MDVTEEVLMMYLDGELDPELATQVQRAVAESPTLAAMETELRTLLGDVTLAFSAAASPMAITGATLNDEVAPFSEKRRAGEDPRVRPIESARSRQSPRGSVSRTGTFARWSVAAGILLFGGAAGTWWFTMREDAGVRAGVSKIADARTPIGTARRPQAGAAPISVPTRPTPKSYDPGTVATSAPSDARKNGEGTPPVGAPIADQPTTRYDVRVPGARVVASADRTGAQAGGDQELEVNGSRIALTYGAKVVGDRVPLSTDEVNKIAESGRTDSVYASTLPGNLPSLNRTRGAAAVQVDQTCADGLRVRDESTGLVMELRGKVSCAQLARLARTIQVLRLQ